MIGVNETFGEIGLITQNTRSATAHSTESSNMLKMNHVDFNTLLGTHPRISALMMKNITSSLSQHIIRMNQSIRTGIFTIGKTRQRHSEIDFFAVKP